MKIIALEEHFRTLITSRKHSSIVQIALSPKIYVI